MQCGSSLNNQVRFIYEDVPSQIALATRDRYYDSGAGQTSLSKRLIRIETAVDAASPAASGTLVQQYKIAYGTSQQSQRSLVSSIQQCAADQVCLPLTQFEWASKDYNTSGRVFSGAPVSIPFGIFSDGVLVGDWNGDGISDIFGWQNVDIGGGNYTHKFYVCLATPTGPQPFDCGQYPLITGPTDTNQTGTYGIQLADINGDGRVDLLYQGPGSGHVFYNVCLSTGDKNGCTVASGSWGTQTPNGPVLQGDVDGDGRLDIITYLGGSQFETCFARDVGFKCVTQTLSFDDSACPPSTPTCEDFTGDSVQYDILLADVNGDGRADLIRRQSGDDDNNDLWKVCFAAFQPAGSSSAPSGSYQCTQRFVHGQKGQTQNNVLYDFNGDGLVDMANYENSQIRVCLSTGDGAFEFTDPNVHWDPSTLTWIDGTGATVDFYTAPRCRLWTGVGNSGSDKVAYGDFNGDGRTDALRYVGGTTWNVCLSTGSNFACSNWTGPDLAATDPDLNQKVVFGDFNGDGRTDILRIDTSNNSGAPVTGYLALAMGPGTVPARAGDVITKITTGLGAVTSVSYAPLTDGSVYARGSGADASQREIDIQSPMYVVQSTSASTGYDALQNALPAFQTTYFYEGLRGRTDGRGLYGFAKKRAIDSSGLVTEVEYYRVSASAYATNWPVVGRPSVARKYAPTTTGYMAHINDVATFAAAASAGSTLIFSGNLALVSQVNTTWEVQTSRSCAGSGACSTSPLIKESSQTQTVQNTWELNGTSAPSPLPSVTTASPLGRLDPYGNQQSVTASTSDQYSKVTTSVFGNDATNWLLGKLLQATVVSTKPDLSSGTRTSSFAYQGFGATCSGAVGGQLCIETIQPDNPGSVSAQCTTTGAADCVTTLYQYDNFGNRSKATVKLKDSDGTVMADRITTTTYGTSNSDNGRFPTTVTNGLSQSETRIFSHKFGIATKVTGPNGVATATLLDGFGRVYGTQVANSGGVKIGESFTPVEATSLQTGEVYRTRSIASGGSESMSYFDQLQRVVRTQARNFTGGLAQSSLGYDALGHKVTSSKPAGSGVVTTVWTYDVLNRVVSESSSGSGVSLSAATTYGTFASGTINVDGAAVGGGTLVSVTQSSPSLSTRTTSKYSNSQGQTVRVIDAEGGYTDYSYDAYGNVGKVIGNASVAPTTEVMTYDRRGRKLTLSSPDSGNWSYAYNGANELSKQTDAKGQVTREYYDVLGRMVERREFPGSESATPFVTVWNYDTYSGGNPCSNAKGKLCEVRTQAVARTTVGAVLPAPETRRTLQYDSSGRVVQSADQVDGRTYVNVTSFDSNGRVDKLMYPSGYMVVNRYTTWGAMDRVAEWTGTATGAIHWLANSRYDDGQISSMAVGNQTTLKSYDGFGRVSSITTGSLQSGNYGFDAVGNLTSRVDVAAQQPNQLMSYDRLNRMVNAAGASVIYDLTGNITSRAGQSYTTANGSHRLQSVAGTSYGYDANGNVTSLSAAGTTRVITPNAFNLPTSITLGSSTNLGYLYDGSHTRIREISVTPQGTATTYYLGGYEEHVRLDGVVEARHYISTPEGAVGIVTLRSDGSNDIRYWHKDHLGSVAVIVDPTGAVKQKYSYDAWGNRSTILQSDQTGEERGFTGHELLAEVGIVHMNGRLYDPATGRMLSADPIVQDRFDGQNYNRYTYVLNNPLSLTDPTGFSFWTKWRRPIAAIGIGVLAWEIAPILAQAAFDNAFATQGIFGAVDAFDTVHAITIVAGGFAAGGVQGGNVESAISGAIFAGVNLGIGDLTTQFADQPFDIGRFSENVALHAGGGCAQQAFAGGTCGAGAAAAGFSAFLGPVSGSGPMSLLAHVAIGAVASKLAKGSAQDGAVTASFEFLFNELLHVKNGPYLSGYETRDPVSNDRIWKLDPSGIDPSIKLDVVTAFNISEAMGDSPLRVVQGLRTQAEQDAIYAQGRTTPGKIVSWTTDSEHVKGLAVDILRIDGNTLYNPSPSTVSIFERFGFEWGGNWTRKPDADHFQR